MKTFERGFVNLPGSVLSMDFDELLTLDLRDRIAALEWVRDNIQAFGCGPSAAYRKRVSPRN